MPVAIDCPFRMHWWLHWNLSNLAESSLVELPWKGLKLATSARPSHKRWWLRYKWWRLVQRLYWSFCQISWVTAAIGPRHLSQKRWSSRCTKSRLAVPSLHAWPWKNSMPAAIDFPFHKHWLSHCEQIRWVEVWQETSHQIVCKHLPIVWTCCSAKSQRYSRARWMATLAEVSSFMPTCFEPPLGRKESQRLSDWCQDIGSCTVILNN